MSSLQLHCRTWKLMANYPRTPGTLDQHTAHLAIGSKAVKLLQDSLQLCTCVDMATGSRWLRDRYKIQTERLEPISSPESNQGSHFLRAGYPDVTLVSFVPSPLDHQFLESTLCLKSEVTPWAKSCYQITIISYKIYRIFYV